jgi:hypothetical protein
MQRAFGIRSSRANSRDALRPKLSFRDLFRLRFAPPQEATRLFHRQRLVKTRLATVGRIAMNNPTLRRFVDRRNCRANLVGVGRWCGADLFLQCAQVGLNASIVGRSYQRLSGTFSG